MAVSPDVPVTQHLRVAYLPREGHPPDGHDTTSLTSLAERIAAFLGRPCHGPCAPGDAAAGFIVPPDTLHADDAQALGIGCSDDLFGGVVPHAFMTTRVISHPVASGSVRVPEGWSHAFAERLGDARLPGCAVFDPDDARAAFRQLHPLGTMRLKLARGVGGGDQWLVEDADELDRILATLAEGELEAHGAVLELNLAEDATWSVGEAELGGHRIAYCGTQRTTPDRTGAQVYGGSTLRIVRGGLEQLLDATTDPGEARAIELARRYDDAVAATWPGFFSSRRNYDVLAGRDPAGGERWGVLEQSWRLGGASRAELCAFEAFADDASLDEVIAASHEEHAFVDVPADAVVHYRGDAPGVGPLTKYSRIERRGHAG